MTQSGAGFMTAALFARPVGASQLAKAVSLASEGAKLSRMHAIGVNRCHGVEIGKVRPQLLAK